ncbi:hypothetical protein UFOVP255_8 [uncultured Caudovirales phage]|uniref:Uncharacterized protein n=1 Tax=uncultured Caudovirales phage TaxID=2100421 RepID=A0A6J5LHJ3_9CAUD|nr:hypothetical protein UFOVP255_8 [uncultured Caudovirales phage]
MEILTHPDNEEIFLKTNCINVITNEKPIKAYLPDPQGKVCFVKVLFTNNPFQSQFISKDIITIGTKTFPSNYIICQCDSQPSFLYVPKKNGWYVISQADWIIPQESVEWKM